MREKWSRGLARKAEMGNAGMQRAVSSRAFHFMCSSYVLLHLLGSDHTVVSSGNQKTAFVFPIVYLMLYYLESPTYFIIE